MITDKRLKYILFGVVLLLIIFSISQCTRANNAETVVENYKQKLIDGGSLRRTEDGVYQKLVSDINTQKQIEKLLKKENKELYTSIKNQNKKIVSLTSLLLKPTDKDNDITDVLKTKDSVTGKEQTNISIFYPKKENYFINYNGIIKDSTLVGNWKFNPIKINIAVSEKTKGLFEADLDAPDWLEVGRIDVNTLPLNISPDNFDWVLGGSIGAEMINYTPTFEITTGIRVKKSIFTINGNTNKELKIGYLKLF